jgi:hypothetical protein
MGVIDKLKEGCRQTVERTKTDPGFAGDMAGGNPLCTALFLLFKGNK